MPRRKKAGVSKPPAPQTAAPEAEVEEQPVTRVDEQGRVIKRPDGYYWEAKGREPRGPFATRAEAEADLLAGGNAPGEFEAADFSDGTLQEAESELGISEWIDPDTGGPAEDNVPRLEDH